MIRDPRVAERPIAVTTTDATAAADLIEAAAGAGGFSTFLALVERAGLSALLRGAARHTVFAPTDEAFAGLASASREKLAASDKSAFLQSVVKGHLVVGRVRLDRFVGRRIRGKSVDGGELVIAGTEGVSVNGAIVVRPDIMAVNGVLHGVDRLLWPEQKAGRKAAPVG